MNNTQGTLTGFRYIQLTEVEAWPGLNPRIGFDPKALEELAQSIEQDGLIQPIAVAPAGVQKKGVKYWVFAGERRLRACRLSPTTTPTSTINVIVHDVDEATAHRLAGIENLDRNDLTAVEEGVWLARELELTGSSQKELGEALGRSQAWVANRIRLLELPKPIRMMIHGGTVAPAMARDTLLRFLKLDKAVQPKLWQAIAKEIKRAAKEASPVLLTALRSAVVQALREAGAVEIREGYHYHTSSNGQYRVSVAKFGAFKKEHPNRCIQAASSSWHGDEAIYTFAVTEWQELIGEAQEEARSTRSTRSTSGVSKKKLEKPKLGPTKKPIDGEELRRKYGHENVIAFDQIVDPSKIEPASVVHVKTRSYENSDGKEGTKLMYVGPNVRALKGARTRSKTPVRAEVAKEVQERRMDAGADLKPGDVLVGILGLIIDTNYSDTLHGMIEAELGREVEWNRYAINTKKIQALKVPAKSVRRIAAGLARIAFSDDRLQWYDLQGDVDKAVEARVTKDTVEARKAWLDEHAPKGAK